SISMKQGSLEPVLNSTSPTGLRLELPERRFSSCSTPLSSTWSGPTYETSKGMSNPERCLRCSHHGVSAPQALRRLYGGLPPLSPLNHHYQARFDSLSHYSCL